MKWIGCLSVLGCLAFVSPAGAQEISVCDIDISVPAADDDVSSVTLRDVKSVRTFRGGGMSARAEGFQCGSDCVASVPDDAILVIAGKTSNCDLHALAALNGGEDFRFVVSFDGNGSGLYDAQRNVYRIPGKSVRGCAARVVK